MISVRHSHERGTGQFSWLHSRHTFSFANYYDPRHMGVSTLRVINDDWVKAGAGFGTHPHRDMEIISYVLEGRIEHQDTMDFHTTLKAGDVQVMSAGTGVLHSEFNPSKTENLNFLQIWIQPSQTGLQPSYAQKNFADTQGVTLIVSNDGRDGSLPINQDTSLYKLNLTQQTTQFNADEGRTYYLHVARGALQVNGVLLQAGDGATLSKERFLNIGALDQCEALLFDLP